MEEWQLGPPLLVGDRVVHLGEVVHYDDYDDYGDYDDYDDYDDACDNYEDDYDVLLFSGGKLRCSS